MRKLGKFMRSIRSHKPTVKVKNVPEKPRSGILSSHRLRNKNKDYTTTYYRSAKRMGYGLPSLVGHLIAQDRIHADPSTGKLLVRRTARSKWKNAAVSRNPKTSRQMVQLYATIDGMYLRCKSTLARVIYMVYHGPHSIPPHHDIDHKNRDIDDDRLDNLTPRPYNKNRSENQHYTGDMSDEF